MRHRFRILAALLGALLAQGCGGGSAASTYNPTPSTTATSTATATPTATPNGGVNLASLPLDDGNVSTSPKVGYVFSCTTSFRGGGAGTDGPWIDSAANTFDLATKLAVQGAVSWNSQYSAVISGNTLEITGNGLPSHTTGTFPIASSDPAYQYDRNPNQIAAQSIAYTLPANPAVAATPSCLQLGPIGIMTTGAQLFNALDADGRDAMAHEVLDSCYGHPDGSSTYHYHGMSPCIPDPGTGHSALIGYARDGFGIYGPRGENGQVLTDADLDACHGHTHSITWNGKSVVMYHYHMTYEYPYSLGCYAGTPTQ